MNQLTINNLITFVEHRWWMCLALIVVLALVIFEEMKRKIGGGNRLSPQNTVNLINHEGAIILDLRDHNVFKAGHIVDAINIPRQDLEKSLDKIKSHKEKPLVLVANLEHEATAVLPKLSAQGFTKVCILANGFAAWKNASLPLVKSK